MMSTSVLPPPRKLHSECDLRTVTSPSLTLAAFNPAMSVSPEMSECPCPSVQLCSFRGQSLLPPPGNQPLGGGGSVLRPGIVAAAAPHPVPAPNTLAVVEEEKPKPKPTPPPPNPNVRTANAIDKYSRVTFPVLFTVFSICYWAIYMSISPSGVPEDFVTLER